MAQHNQDYRKSLRSALRNKKLADSFMDSIHDLQVFAAANGGTIVKPILNSSISRSAQTPYELNNSIKWGAVEPISSMRKVLRAALSNKALADKTLNIILELQSYILTAAKQTTSIEAVADVAASLDGTTFILEDINGTVAFWIDVDNDGTTIPAEASAAERAIEITTITTGMTAAEVGTEVYTAIIADSKFEAGSDDLAGNLIIQNVDEGYFVNADASTSGFTIAIADPGSLAGSADKMVVQNVVPGNTPFSTSNTRALASALNHAALAEDIINMILELQIQFRDNLIGTCDGNLVNDLLTV